MLGLHPAASRSIARRWRCSRPQDADHLVGNLDTVFRDDMLTTHVEELVQLWEGKPPSKATPSIIRCRAAGSTSSCMAASCRATRRTGQRVLVAIEDVTERENARRRLTQSENYALGLFAHSPVSLWVEDFSGVKKLLDEIRDARHHRFPRLHRRASGIRHPLHERNPRARRQPPHARIVRRARQGGAAACPAATCSATTWRRISASS